MNSNQNQNFSALPEPIKKEIVRVSWKELDCAIHLLADRIKKAIPDIKERYLVAVVRGGMVPCGMLAHLLEAPVRGTIRVSTYNNNEFPGHPKITEDTYFPAHIVPKLLFVDDIVDSGATVRALAYHYPQARFVTPFAKPKGLAYVPSFLVPIEPPGLYKDTDWIEFPWDSNLKPQDKKDHPHG